MKPEDSELLVSYAAGGAEDAFTELVRRHLDLVWATAHRITGDAGTASDVAQSVFIDLAKKARFFPNSAPLAPWLYRAAVLASRNHARANLRRANRERLAMESHELNCGPPAPEPELEPLAAMLDEALSALPEREREALVLRFFARKSLAEVGAALQINADTAQKRLSRSLERLRKFFASRGATLSAGAVTALVTAAGAKAAPAGLVLSVSSASLAAAAGSASLWLSVLQKQIALMKTKVLIGTLAAATLTTPLFLEHRTLAALRAEHAAQLGLAPAEGESNRRESALLGELAQLRRDHEELARLREEEAVLRGRLDGPGRDLRRQLAAAQAELRATTRSADTIKTEMQAAQLSEDTISAMKHIGLAARIHAEDMRSRMPDNFEDLKKVLPPTLPGQLELDRFEFVKHGRPVTGAEPQLLLFREKEPRQQPDGSWSRSYTFCDGSVQEKNLKEPNFEEWEKQFLAKPAAPAARPAPQP